MQVKITVYTVAPSPEEAAEYVSGTWPKYSRPFGSTLTTKGAAKLYAAGCKRTDGRKLNVYPVAVTFDVGDALTPCKRKQKGE